MGNFIGSIIGGASGGTAGALGGGRAGWVQEQVAGRAQGEAEQQQRKMEGYYDQNYQNMQGANSAYQNQAQQGYGSMMNAIGGYGNNLSNQTSQLSSWQNNAAMTAYQGALSNIYTQGRNQAAGSGLIGGFQEGQNTSPAIANLAQNFASQQVENSRQNMLTQIGVGQQIYGQQSNAAQYGYGQVNQAYGQAAQGYSALAGQALQGVYGAGQKRVDAAGLYGDWLSSSAEGNIAGSQAGASVGGGMGGGGSSSGGISGFGGVRSQSYGRNG